MPSFEYTGIDRQGKSVQGQVTAATRDEAALTLTQSGLLVSRLSQTGAAPVQSSARIQGAPAPPIVQGSSAVKQGAPPVLGAQPAAPVRPAIRPKIAPSQKKPPVRTKRGSDKDLYFVFSQLQSYARSGLNPVEALTNVANGCSRSRPDYSKALHEAADAAKEGRPLSEVFERYVDLFPPHVVGMVRAAEQGGFFPEAYDLITDQAHASHKLRIWFRWLLAIAIMVGVCFPITQVMFRAAVDSWDVQEKSGGTAPGMPTLLHAIGSELLWPCGPVILALILGFWLFGHFWQSMPRRELRHRLVLMVPSVKNRAKAESLSVFAWTMGMLSKVGLPPKTVWDLSVGTIPNLAVRNDLNNTGARMTEQTRLSEAMLMSQHLPEEYAPIVQTGEVTGDVPGALMRASQSQLEEFKAGDQATKARVGCWMLLIMVVGSLIMFGMFYGGFTKTMMDKILKDG